MMTVNAAEQPDMIAALLPKRGRLFVISGPSGVGKGTVIATMLRSPSAPPGVVRCTTATTRTPRVGEVNGRNYHFFSQDEFRYKIEEGFFLEHARYNDNLYGTPRESVEKERAARRDVLLEIEVQGGLTIRRIDREAVLVFLAPPSWGALDRLLRRRATDGPAAVERRLGIAKREMEAAPLYDYLIVNDDVERAADQLRAVILSERQRIMTADL
jgi:guanylate kinase